MPQYRLYYFDGRGRAELSRLIFTAADQAFDDVRYEYEHEWPKHKAEFSDFGGLLPVLEVDGEKVGQSAAMAHYLATQLGLAGQTPIDAMKCHMLAETARDLMEPVARMMFYEQDEKRKAKMQEEYEKVTMKNALKNLEKYTAKHAGPSGFLVADMLTYADLALYNVFYNIGLFLKRDALAGYEQLSKHSHTVGAVPRIAEYIAKRKQTDW